MRPRVVVLGDAPDPAAGGGVRPPVDRDREADDAAYAAVINVVMGGVTPRPPTSFDEKQRQRFWQRFEDVLSGGRS